LAHEATLELPDISTSTGLAAVIVLACLHEILAAFTLAGLFWLNGLPWCHLCRQASSFLGFMAATLFGIAGFSA
jgi:hypothetical protein